MKDKDKAEEQLLRHTLKEAIDILPLGITIRDIDGKILYTNPAEAVMHGYKVEELVGKESKILGPREKWSSMTIEQFKKIDAWKRESLNKRKDGTMFPVQLISYVIKDEEGSPIGLVTSCEDITERKQAEKALQESEKKYRILVEESHDAIYIYRDNAFLFVNERFCEITGYNKEGLYQMNMLELVYSLDGDVVRDITGSKIEGEFSPKTYEARFLRKHGEIRYCEISVNQITYRGEPAVMGAVRDITEYKEMEKELRRAEKLESLGILAGGIAHDFNNILTGIMGDIYLAKMELDPKSEAYKILEEAETASHGAKGLTQQLLTFSRGGEPVREKSSIPDLIKESVEFSLRGSNVRCEFSVPDTLWMLNVDKGQISQVINNIVINADQAMPEGGIIKVGAENIIIKEDDVLSLDEGRYVKITVEDKGIGISKEHLSKIFDPYFSTKQSGSGLGLATAYSIIEKHGGYITAESEVGVGSTFYVYLPALKEKLEEEEVERGEIIAREAKVLLMDDEEVIREVVGRMLKRLGCEVEYASRGEEAIDKYKGALKSGDAFDVVIMDLTVPGYMGGKEAIGKFIKIDPEVKAIVSSGYSNDPVMANYKKYGFSGVVTKPYDTKELAQALRKVLKKKKKGN